MYGHSSPLGILRKGSFCPGGLGRTLRRLIFYKLPGDAEAAGPGNTLSNKDVGKRPHWCRGQTSLNSSLSSTSCGPQAGPRAFYLINGHIIIKFAPRNSKSSTDPSPPCVDTFGVEWVTCGVGEVTLTHLLSVSSPPAPGPLSFSYCFFFLTSVL